MMLETISQYQENPVQILRCHSEHWLSLFTLHCFNSFSCTREFLATHNNRHLCI